MPFEIGANGDIHIMKNLTSAYISLTLPSYLPVDEVFVLCHSILYDCCMFVFVYIKMVH